jgi:MFS family permease
MGPSVSIAAKEQPEETMASTGAVEGRSLFSNRWWIVFASLIGNIVGPGPAVIFTVNVFMVPVTSALGWSRGLFSSGLLASALVAPIMTPLFGHLLDRFGIHRVALPTTFLYGLALCSFALLTPDHVWPLYFMFACASGFGACMGPIVYSKSITAWFDRERGLALGIATCGVGLGTLLLPVLAQRVIATYGWRPAYVVVGIVTWLLSFSMIALFVREPPGHFEHMRAARTTALPYGPQPLGISTRAAITGTRQFWLLAAIFLMEGTANNGILSGHFVPMLTDRGYTPAAAAGLLGLSGIAAMVARIIVGLCLDWVNGPIFSAFTMLLPVAAIGLLLSHAGSPAPFLAALCFGLSIGAEVDMLGFFVSRYFGHRSFGTLYGLIFALFALGIGVGPAILGWGFDRFHSYDHVLWGFFGVLIVAAALFLPLGKYPYPKGSQ